MEPIAGHDVCFGFDEQAEGLKVTDAGGVDERGTAVGILRVNGCTVFKKGGEALAVVAVQWGSGGVEQCEQGRQGVCAGAVRVGAFGEGGFEEGQVPLLDGLKQLQVGRRSWLGLACGFGTEGSGGRCERAECKKAAPPAQQPSLAGAQADCMVHSVLVTEHRLSDKCDSAASAIEWNAGV